MSAERWRCFVAAPIDDDLRAALWRSIGSWRPRPDLASLRWTDPATWHVTLAFLGAVEPDDVPGLEAMLAAVAERHPAAAVFETGGVGAFPQPEAARVAWYGVHDPAGMMERLATDVGKTLGVDEERAFHPHLTLARAAGRPVDLRAWMAEAEVPSAALLLERMLLVRSHLERDAARHETLASFTLGGGAHE
jgi:2'-5' RNA ligase